MASINLDYLIPDLRLLIGDIDPATYRYMDTWLLRALTLAVKSLKRYLNNKYLVTDTGDVSRNEYFVFTWDESLGIIEGSDEYLIVLKAAIITLNGSLENSAWDLQSWKDAEISVSNQEVSKSKNRILDGLLEEFNKLVLSPRERLARTIKGSLPGFINNLNERTTQY